MKVRHKIILTLFLAAPLNLVSANESLPLIDHEKTMGGDSNIERLKEVKISTPMTYADVVVVAPDLKYRRVRYVQLPTQIKFDDMSDLTEIAYRD
ncbi:MAG: hypothetical protein HKN08_12175 [Gammaproteobacteria bacterium]|nr:hypothetical protein [Gammaproteobacteria bacterium]